MKKNSNNGTRNHGHCNCGRAGQPIVKSNEPDGVTMRIRKQPGNMKTKPQNISIHIGANVLAIEKKIK